jgi:transcription initiation factor TFIID subunit TAF12
MYPADNGYGGVPIDALSSHVAALHHARANAAALSAAQAAAEQSKQQEMKQRLVQQKMKLMQQQQQQQQRKITPAATGLPSHPTSSSMLKASVSEHAPGLT